MFRKIKYEIWPYLKVRLLFFWWIIRYGGARNIPREMLRKKTEDNILRMKESLMNAIRAIPDNATEEERQMLFDAVRECGEVERLYQESQKE
jgi:hypothetical protein